MSSRATPKISVIILNWNGKRFLKRCLSSLFSLTYANYEVIVVDNNSSDGSVHFIHQKFPRVKVIASPVNNGFARGNNIGASVAKGEYLLFLNNDTKVTPDLLTTLVHTLKSDRHIGCLQPEMRVMDEPQLLDEAGGYLTFTGFLYHYGYRKKYSLPMYRGERNIFSAKGACMLIPKNIFERVGKFDEDFFIFFEETDLCFRIWLAGYRVVYAPDAYIYHVAGGDTTTTYDYERRMYLTFKNMNCSYLKNFGWASLCTIFPVFVSAQIALFIYFLCTSRAQVALAICRGQWWNVRHFFETMRKRDHIQKNLRSVTDWNLWKSILYNPGIKYYLLLDAKKYTDGFIRN